MDGESSTWRVAGTDSSGRHSKQAWFSRQVVKSEAASQEKTGGIVSRKTENKRKGCRAGAVAATTTVVVTAAISYNVAACLPASVPQKYASL